MDATSHISSVQNNLLAISTRLVPNKKEAFLDIRIYLIAATILFTIKLIIHVANHISHWFFSNQTPSKSPETEELTHLKPNALFICPGSTLEEKYQNLTMCAVDILHNCDFENYLIPNEMNPIDCKPHLDAAGNGIIVSTGTERSFIDLALSDPAKTTGLVVVDINHRVKAYVDFNTLLLRISENREDYLKLSEQPLSEAASNERISLIKQKMKKAQLPDNVHAYYLKYLKDFSSIYWKNYNSWRLESDDYFKGCRYYLNDDQFAKLQQYAQSGKIISVIGDINDLTFLEEQVSIVDTSNIKDYCMLKIEGKGDFCPRILMVSGQGRRITDSNISTYSSYLHKALTKDEVKELDTLRKKISPEGPVYQSWMKNQLGLFMNPDPFNAAIGPIYSRETLTALRKYVEQNVIEISPLIFFDKTNAISYKILNTASSEEIELLLENPKLKTFLANLVRSWSGDGINPSVYLKFSKIDGWKNVIQSHFEDPRQAFPAFLSYLKNDGLLQFIAIFGKERFNALIEKLESNPQFKKEYPNFKRSYYQF